MYHLAIDSTFLIGIPGSYCDRIIKAILNTEHDPGYVLHVEVDSLPDMVWLRSILILDIVIKFGAEIEFPLFYLTHPDPLIVHLKSQIPERIQPPNDVFLGNGEG